MKFFLVALLLPVTVAAQCPDGYNRYVDIQGGAPFNVSMGVRWQWNMLGVGAGMRSWLAGGGGKSSAPQDPELSPFVLADIRAPLSGCFQLSVAGWAGIRLYGLGLRAGLQLDPGGDIVFIEPGYGQEGRELDVGVQLRF